MSEEQLSALLAKLKNDVELQETFKGAADLDTAAALAKEAGFNISKADLIKFQAKQTLELSDEELEDVSGGATPLVPVGWMVAMGIAGAVKTGVVAYTVAKCNK